MGVERTNSTGSTGLANAVNLAKNRRGSTAKDISKMKRKKGMTREDTTTAESMTSEEEEEEKIEEYIMDSTGQLLEATLPFVIASITSGAEGTSFALVLAYLVDTSLILPLLLVFRQFTTVSHMLKLVIERFDLPKTSFTSPSTLTRSWSSPSTSTQLPTLPKTPEPSPLPPTPASPTTIGIPTSLWLEVAQPVQMRTVNILKLWVTHHWYATQVS